MRNIRMTVLQVTIGTFKGQSLILMLSRWVAYHLLGRCLLTSMSGIASRRRIPMNSFFILPTPFRQLDEWWSSLMIILSLSQLLMYKYTIQTSHEYAYWRFVSGHYESNQCLYTILDAILGDSSWDRLTAGQQMYSHSHCHRDSLWWEETKNTPQMGRDLPLWECQLRTRNPVFKFSDLSYNVEMLVDDPVISDRKFNVFASAIHLLEHWEDCASQDRAVCQCWRWACISNETQPIESDHGRRELEFKALTRRSEGWGHCSVDHKRQRLPFSSFGRMTSCSIRS